MTGNFFEISLVTYVPVLKIWRFFICTIVFHALHVLLAFAYRWIAWHIPQLIHFSTFNSVSIAVKWIDFYFGLKAAYLAKPGAEKQLAGSSSYIPGHIFRKLLNTSTSNNSSLWTYKSPKISIWNLYKLFLHACNLHQ